MKKHIGFFLFFFLLITASCQEGEIDSMCDVNTLSILNISNSLDVPITVILKSNFNDDIRDTLFIDEYSNSDNLVVPSNVISMCVQNEKYEMENGKTFVLKSCNMCKISIYDRKDGKHAFIADPSYSYEDDDYMYMP